MSKKYHELAQAIIDNLGGKENVQDVYHCQTRLRFKLKDGQLVQKSQLEELEGVTMYLFNAGVHQVVIGTHVKNVFEEIEPLVDLNKDEDGKLETEKLSPVQTLISFVAAVFQPIIPALSGAGMVKAVLALLVVFKLISNTSQTYVMLNTFSDGVFYFLPLLLAFTTAQKLKTNPILAVGVIAMMLHPNWITFLTAGEKVAFFDLIPFTLATYSSSVIPAILIVFVQSYVERLLKRIIPKSVELIFVPMFIFLIMGTLAFSILGPIGAIIGNLLADGFTYLSETISWLPPVLIGALLPIMVMFGIHNAIAPLGIMQMSQLGYDSIFGPGALVSNIAQATAASIVAIRTKDKKLKQVASSGALTGYMGITEPILYGVNLPKKYPLYASMIGGGLGGLYAGVMQVHRFATGSSGLPAVLLYIGDNTMEFFWNIIIAIIITVTSTAIITYFLSLRFEEKVPSELELPAEKLVALSDTLITAPISGQVIELSQVADPVFASESLGKGFAIQPNAELVVAPFDGQVITVLPTKHAIGLLSDSGLELLIHIGLDTVNLNGQFFESYVKEGDKVAKGQKLISFEKMAIENAGYQTEIPIVVTNTANFVDFKLMANGTIETMEPVLKVQI
ncbi:beta-glucoside-specific PTS transporter subunit IIABC [Streptococcus parauberis]|uniref:beta-glucoside-specific PTS transporter subunit IIABC n=1 Tax=Streptococcus parauberis TaxID=1348 RepID=UPI0002BB7F86|nr:beta-glucoside-specific PTS transporter subunit IIABC [Streptococcus parauberis]EMF49850.1 PTS system, beta-glucoside-specific IIABC component [Streptococcus parauberis KRS-02109]UWM87951.1 beta-glucoside-specific PTS transporter subunit IIABC [Streptococcus parauberis]UWM89923.1 beta-glucoside-specific PTS transporter subunit IIABC [Streptococcus parauberis]UWM91728.1 beta-glucoside-specific PTS transporter subunit IIABC [Streptococcus parauberis]WEM60529.1 beta-glucoside-specific PTS tran